MEFVIVCSQYVPFWYLPKLSCHLSNPVCYYSSSLQIVPFCFYDIHMSMYICIFKSGFFIWEKSINIFPMHLLSSLLPFLPLTLYPVPESPCVYISYICTNCLYGYDLFISTDDLQFHIPFLINGVIILFFVLNQNSSLCIYYKTVLSLFVCWKNSRLLPNIGYSE